jgi:two-component system NtrC family sensor kinase
MHSTILIPVVAIMVSAAFGAVSVTWDSDRRATSAMSAIFVCTGVWALLDLMTFLTTDPDHARFWMQWMFLPALLLGPSVTWLLGHVFPQIGKRLYGLARLGFALSVVLGVSAALTPGTIGEVVAVPWGSWLGRYGTMAIFVAPTGTILPLLALYEVSRLDRPIRPPRSDARRAKAMTFAVAVSLLAATSTEYVLPVLEILVPRMGAISISCVAAAVWLFILHDGNDLAMTPEGTARSMLAELHDGVALLGLDGSILAANLRFEELTGRSRAVLIGASLIDWVECSLEEISNGFEDRETGLRGVHGEFLPVSLSSSIARGREQEAIGAVVIIRDMREIDALRRRLLTSGRLAAIGELAAGIAHEVNNPIAFIRSDLNLLSQRLQEIKQDVSHEPRRESEVSILEGVGGRIEIALEGVERVAQVVNDVRGFAHVGGRGQGGSDPNVLLEGAMRLARLQRGGEVELRVRDAECGDWIDSGQELKQVLLALLLVLVESLEQGGLIEGAVESDRKHLRIVLSADPLREDSTAMIRRFESIAAGDLDASNSEFRIVIATELIHELGASFTFTSSGPDSLSVELQLPLEAESSE